jgi:hypothetical protein
MEDTKFAAAKDQAERFLKEKKYQECIQATKRGVGDVHDEEHKAALNLFILKVQQGIEDDKFAAAKADAERLLGSEKYAECIQATKRAVEDAQADEHRAALKQLILKAEQGIDDRDFKEALSKPDGKEKETALQSYVKDHPAGAHAKEATDAANREWAKREIAQESADWSAIEKQLDEIKIPAGQEESSITVLAEFLARHPAGVHRDQARARIVKWCWNRFGNNVKPRYVDPAPQGIRVTRTGVELRGPFHEKKGGYLVTTRRPSGREDESFVPKQDGVVIYAPDKDKVDAYNHKLIDIQENTSSAEDIARFAAFCATAGFDAEALEAYLLAGNLDPSLPDVSKKLTQLGYEFKRNRWTKR